MAATAMQRPDHIFRSLKEPALANPRMAPIAKTMIAAMEPPFFSDFRVAILTIPPTRSMMATSVPALPLTSPFSASVFATPAAQDWKMTKADRTMHRMPFPPKWWERLPLTNYKMSFIIHEN